MIKEQDIIMHTEFNTQWESKMKGINLKLCGEIIRQYFMLQINTL